MKHWVIACMLLSLVGCSKGKDKNASFNLRDDVVAEVNGRMITLDEFNQRFDWYVDRFKFRVTKKEFLENLINLEISAEESKRKGLNKSDKVIYDYKVLLSQHLLEKEVYSKFKDIKYSDDELRAHFESSPSIRASHILFKIKKDEDEKTVAAVKKKAARVLKKAKAGSNFAKLAKKYSEGPSKKNGGDLDFFTRQTMVKEFSEAAFLLKKVGDISDLVRTKYGFHIIKLTGRKKFEEADKRRLKSQLRSKKQKEIYDGFFAKLKEKANIKINEKLLEE